MITKHQWSNLFLILFIWNTGFAQERVIEGKITDEEGNPVSGVLVTVKDKDISVNSDNNGYFILNLSPETFTTLLFSHSECKAPLLWWV